MIPELSRTLRVHEIGSTPYTLQIDAKPAEREALMLESVRTLVRATAGEIAQHGGLPSGTAYVVLKQLISNGRVAKTETARGVEYSLVSTGAVRPFKRARGGSVEAATAEEQIPSATGEA